jgi:anti-sigma factor RsiW
MALRHLNDLEIQNYLDDKQRRSSQFSDHIENCAHCQQQVQQYQNLYSTLSREPATALRFDFADIVMAKLKTGADEAFSLPIWMAFFGMIVGVATTLYFVGMAKLSSFLNGLQSLASADWQILSTINKYLAGLHLNLGLLGLAVFIIMMMSLVDRFVFQSRHKLISFFK